jgi:hypothetical protein
LRFACIEGRQIIEAAIQGNEIKPRLRGNRRRFVEGFRLHVSSALGGRFLTRMIDKNPPHHLCCDGEKVRPAGPSWILLTA